MVLVLRGGTVLAGNGVMEDVCRDNLQSVPPATAMCIRARAGHFFACGMGCVHQALDFPASVKHLVGSPISIKFCTTYVGKFL